MEFIDAKLDDYCCEHTTSESDFLYDLNRKTHIKILQPRMLSGHFQGRLLSMLSHMIRPKNMLEIGTYTGYSAFCFLEGLQAEGKITTIDCNAELEEFVQNYIDTHPRGNQVSYIIGDAMELIPSLDESFDFVFIDADKENYLSYYQMIIDKVPSGGYILADNVLWSGKVIEETSFNDRDTKAIREFNAYVQADTRVENVLLPIRDGLMLIRKL
jgi:caffeoyl-CoA O-methyltransferase